MTADSVAGQMRSAATVLLQAMEGEQRRLANLPFADESARRWLEYRPSDRPGACLALIRPAARKAAHRLLSTALSGRAYAQAMVIMALEEVLDRKEAWRRGRHSGDYWISVFGEPGKKEPWAWRFGGPRLSESMTLRGEEIPRSPGVFRANPA